MLAASLFVSLLLVLSLCVPTTVAQTAVYGFCFTDSSKPGSPYGPWSVATWGTLTVNSTSFVSTVSTSGGGGRPAYQVMSASAQRLQLNRDGTQSTAQLGLCPVGTQGSDAVLYTNNQPTSDSQHTHYDSTPHDRDNNVYFPAHLPCFAVR